ncbi:type I-C CRISPR-associated protein Cas8c/Csd1 [Pasteurellaceae bacterium Orientalotternb1]|nr:type I-C CRISPR-associated protein Cas8c/Csd1 [Pasteurellaceae bacterium Orientalotternb1]
MLPVTEESENRTSGEAPHPFADKLQYVAKDYSDFGGEKKAYFESYLKQLQEWCDSPFSHPKVQAVLNYVRKGNVIADLVKEGIFPTTTEGKVLTKWEEKTEAPEIFAVLPKTKGEIEFGSALICWSVEIAGDVESDTWKDESIQQSWIDYLSNNESQKGFCFVKGKESAIAKMHPAKLRHTGDKAKLISSNDNAGYTFRGKFENADEAAVVSAEVSAKSHGALRWLIGRQGIRNGDQVTVAWVMSGKVLPQPLEDNFSFLSEEADLELSVSKETPEINQESETTSKWAANLGAQAATIIKKKLFGLKAELKDHEMISLLMLDSATQGRMALTYYQEFLPKDYFQHLDAWLDDFSWYQRYSLEDGSSKKKAKRIEWLYLPPSPFAIAQTLLTKQDLEDKDKKALRQFCSRLLPVIVGGNKVPIPYDLVIQSFERACNPNSCENWEWQRNIGVACALYKGWRARHNDPSQRREFTMKLETENASRDYLFGRLLALAEDLEQMALRIANETRATNAERYMQQFANRPFQTWKQLELNLKNYKDRLRKDYPVKVSDKFTLTNPIAYLKRREIEITEILNALDKLRQQKCCELDTPLNPEFLLGYHSQKMAFRYTAKDDASSDSETV